MSGTSIFAALGLEVIAVENGVYHFRYAFHNSVETVERIGLLFSDERLHEASRCIKLFLLDVPSNVSAQRIIRHWQGLDARRLEESGLDPLEIELQPEQIEKVQEDIQYIRPDGERLRYAARLTTGEVVCYN